jgi:CHAD domain-containing protein
VTSVTTFRVPDHETAAVTDALTDLGFDFGERRPFATTLVDTFDGRVHRAGLRLEMRTSGGIELVLSGPDAVPAHLTLDAAPRVLSDLPAGPFRSRLASLVDVRSLIPQVRVRMGRSTGVWRDGTGKVVAIAELLDQVQVVNRPDVDRCTSIEVHAVPGYDKRAERAVSALRDAGLEECEIDTLAQRAAAAGVDLAGFKAAATVPLDPDMAALEGVRAVLANLAVAIVANWQGAVEQTDTKFLHDLRIALRRTRTVLAASNAVLPRGVREPAKQDFAWLAGATGAARDLDVYLLEWERYTDPLGADAAAALRPVRDALTRHHHDAHSELEGVLRSERAAAVIEEWRRWLAEPVGVEDRPRRADQPLGKVVAKRVAAAHDALIDRGRRIGADTPAEDVHDLRKDAKKLRYLLECFGSVLPDKPLRKYVKRLKALQENLGEHQDAEVHIALLRSLTPELVATGAAADTMVAIGQLAERLDRTRMAARAEFAERFADYDSPATRRSFDALIEAIAT